MVELLKLREQAFKLANLKYKVGNTDFTQYSGIYLASTSNTKKMMELYKDARTVLAEGSTGAIGYEAILNGAVKVDLFDINELQRLFFLYMKTAIEVLSYEDFIKHFTLKEQYTMMPKDKIKDLLSNELYEKLRFYLDDDVEFVFGPLFDYFYSSDLILSGLFRFEHPINIDYLKRTVSFYNEEEYYKLQKLLRQEKVEINYYTCSLMDVPTIFDEQYDLIALDNILQTYQKIKGIETVYETNRFVDKKLGKLLTDDGVIQAAYGFEIATDALKETLKIPFDKNFSNDNPISRYAIKEDMKNGICSGLIKKWDHYSYDFIEGVEENNGIISDNVVLTYKKRK